MSVKKWVMSDEWWVMSDEWWVMEIEWRKLSDEKSLPKQVLSNLESCNGNRDEWSEKDCHKFKQ